MDEELAIVITFGHVIIHQTKISQLFKSSQRLQICKRLQLIVGENESFEVGERECEVIFEFVDSIVAC